MGFAKRGGLPCRVCESIHAHVVACQSHAVPMTTSSHTHSLASLGAPPPGGALSRETSDRTACVRLHVPGSTLDASAQRHSVPPRISPRHVWPCRLCLEESTVQNEDYITCRNSA